MFINPDIQSVEFPKSADKLTQAIKRANNADPKYRDVRYLMSLLQRLDLVHPRIKSHKRRRRSIIASADWDIIPFDDKNFELAQAAKKRLSDCINESFQTFVEGELYGVSLTRLFWRLKSGSYYPEVEYRYKPVELERMGGFVNNIAILGELDNMQFERLEIPENEKHFYLGYEEDNTEPGGLLRSIIFLVFMLNLNQQEWSVFITFLKGIIQGVVNVSATPSEKVAAQAALESAVENKFVMTSDRVSFEFKKIVDDLAGQNFETLKVTLQEDIEIAITGASSLATDKMRNAPTVMERSEEDIARWGRLEFAKMLNRQLLTYDWFMNVTEADGYDAELPYFFGFKEKLALDRLMNAQIIQTGVDMGIEIAKAEFTRWTGIELAAKDDDIIPIAQPYEPPQFGQSEPNAQNAAPNFEKSEPEEPEGDSAADETGYN